jgi:hypothetical protein
MWCILVLKKCPRRQKHGSDKRVRSETPPDTGGEFLLFHLWIGRIEEVLVCLCMSSVGLQANVAKLDSAIAIYADKLELRVGGFSDKLLKLVSRLFKELR